MQVYLFGYSKKKNSTAQPTLTSGTSFTMQLKDDTSVMNPVLLLNQATSGMPNPFTPSYYTYAYIAQFSRYYFVVDWQWVNGLWELYLTEDVLASFKSGIGALSEYVVRSASSYDGHISDVFYPTHTNVTLSRKTVNLSLDTTGFYIIGIINNLSSASTGAITYYFLSAAQMANVKSYLMSETFLTDNGLAALQDVNKELIKCLYNPYQYIASCKFIPLTMPTVGITEVMKFGWWSLPYSGARMSVPYVGVTTATFTTSAHPQAATRGSYLNHAPYTERYIMHPLFGTILLDANKIDAGDSIALSIQCDVITGEATFYIINSTKSITLYESTIMLGVDIQLAQINTDVIGMARTAVESTGNVISSALRLDVAGAITSAATGVLNTLEASIPVLQSGGSNGNMSMFNLNADYIECFRNLVNEDNANKGRPLCQVKQISALSGYIQCSDAHAELSCYDAERSQIVNYMNTGFYYE